MKKNIDTFKRRSICACTAIGAVEACGFAAVCINKYNAILVIALL
jgi:hypothetical protein